MSSSPDDTSDEKEDDCRGSSDDEDVGEDDWTAALCASGLSGSTEVSTSPGSGGALQGADSTVRSGTITSVLLLLKQQAVVAAAAF